MASGADAHEILPGLWLGNRVAALNDRWLQSKGIETVFNCTKDIPFSPAVKRQYRLPVDDNLKDVEIRNMTLWSHEVVYKVLAEYNRGQPILVHCAAGMQRSAAVVAMTLIAMKGMGPQQAITYIQGIRPIAFQPSANFRQSIQEFYKTYLEEIQPKLRQR
jgi:protein-tyrosine phosphatase